MKKLLAFLVAGIFARSVTAQISVSPIFPTADDIVTITYDATQGSRGLVDEPLDVYIYTGVITDKSTTPSDWKYVKVPDFKTNTPDVKMTRSTTNANLYSISFKIRDFYGVPTTENVKRLAMVFRNANAQHEGKTTTNGDIFYDVYGANAALQTKLLSPSVSGLFLKKGDMIAVSAVASTNATLTLSDNGTILTTLTNSKTLATNITAVDGNHTVVFKADNGISVDSAQFTYSVAAQNTIAALPSNSELGATFNAAGDSLTFILQAPNKANVYVIGSFNDYAVDKKYLMNITADGKYFWLKIGGLTPQKIYTYQYYIDNGIKIADPLSTLILDPYNDNRISAVTYPNLPAYPSDKTTGFVSVVASNYAAYNWKNTNFSRPAKSKLVIYELHIRDFIARHDYQTMIDTLGYLQKLGITAIELMPVNEFDNNESWGYNPTFHNALDKYYGTATKFKEFIDTCHSRGIAVILDVVFNHIWGNSSLANMYPPAANPYLNLVATHPYSVGVDFNHESEFTQNYVIKCIKTWLTDYKVDGFRFDLAKGFTQKVSNNDADFARYDPSRIAILNKYHKAVQTFSPNAYTILELFSDAQEELELANNGMMMWANLNYDASNAAQGKNGSIEYLTANARNWSTPATADKLIAYMESHDEQRLMYNNLTYGQFNGDYNIRDKATALKRIELMNAFYFTLPGAKMFWQFGELGYDYDINYNCRVCNKPIRWDYLNDVNRKRLYDVTSSLLDLRNTYPVFQNGTYAPSDLRAGATKAFHLTDNNMQVVVLGNFAIEPYDVTPNFQTTGKWYNFFKGDSITVTNTSDAINLQPGEYRIYTTKKLKKPVGDYAFFTPLNIVDESLARFSVFPNPISVTEKIQVALNFSSETECSFKLTNVLGETVYQSVSKKYTTGAQTETITAPLTSGVYFITANAKGAIKTTKVFVE